MRKCAPCIFSRNTFWTWSFPSYPSNRIYICIYLQPRPHAKYTHWLWTATDVSQRVFQTTRRSPSPQTNNATTTPSYPLGWDTTKQSLVVVGWRLFAFGLCVRSRMTSKRCPVGKRCGGWWWAMFRYKENSWCWIQSGYIRFYCKRMRHRSYQFHDQSAIYGFLKCVFVWGHTSNGYCLSSKEVNGKYIQNGKCLNDSWFLWMENFELK